MGNLRSSAPNQAGVPHSAQNKTKEG